MAWFAAGPAAGTAAVGLDLFFAHRGAAVPATSMWPALGLGLLAGLMVGGLAETLFLLLSRSALFRMAHRDQGLVWWQLLSLPWLPLSWILAEGSLSGHRVRLIGDPLWTVPLAALAVAWAAGGAVYCALWMMGRQQSQKGSVAWRWMGIVALLGLAGSLSGLNARLYVRLYPEIHAAMTLTSFLTFFVSFGLVAVRLKVRRRTAVGVTLAAFAVTALLGQTAVGPLRRTQRVRRLVFSLPTTGLVLSLVARRGSGPEGSTSLPGNGEVLVHGLHENGPIHLDGASVLLVTVDALRADRVGCFGNRHTKSLTPHLDRLCRSAVKFERTYCHAPHSSYSLSSIQTGMPMRSLVALGEPLPRTLADILSRRGYQTQAFCTNGIFFTEGEKLTDYRRRGFGFAHFDPNGYDGKVLTDKAMAALDRLAADPRPFYLWVHYFDVHEPYRFHRGITEGHGARARYDGEVRYVDPLVSKLIRRALGLGRPLLVVLTADHGEEFGEHGGSYHGSSVYEEQVRVPLIWWIPGIASRRVDFPVSLIDVMPTILDILSIPYQGALEGRSLAALAAGEDGGLGPVFAEVSTKRMVVDGRFKLIYDSWRSIAELYDLSSDPRERKNLADSMPDQVSRLRRILTAQAAHLSSRLAGLPKALALARLGDSRAKEGLCRLLLDPKAGMDHRIEAARRLAKMPGGCSERALCETLLLPGRKLRREAGVALGELESACGRAELLVLLSEAVPARLRHRAAVAAGRLGLREAQPYLVEALADPDPTIRYRAGHYLGRIGDRRAVRALMAATADRSAAHLVAFALGRIGARSGGQVSADVGRFLRDWLPRAHSLLVKRYILKAMGLLARPDLAALALPYLGRSSMREAEETLVRCRGIGRFVFGLDFSPLLKDSGRAEGRRISNKGSTLRFPQASGLIDCQARNPLDFQYLHATTCRMRGGADLRFGGPESLSGSWTVSLRVLVPRRVGTRARIDLWMAGRNLGSRSLVAGWQDVTWRFQTGQSDAGTEARESGGSSITSSRTGQGSREAMDQQDDGHVLFARLRVEPSNVELVLDHLLLFRSPPGSRARSGAPSALSPRQTGKADASR